MSIRKKIVQTLVYSTMIAMVPATLFGVYRANEYAVVEKWKYDHREQLASIQLDKQRSASILCDIYRNIKPLALQNPDSWKDVDFSIYKENCKMAGREP